jgi:CubicO group peptidase (beta-lactamase class C family)
VIPAINHMNKQLKNIFTILLALIVFNLKAQKSVDEIVEAYMAIHKIPGLSLAIVEDDSIKTLSAYGLSSIQHEANVDVSTTFELASLTKQFTAAAILKLQQDGKLNVNDYLHQYFFECPEHWKSITIKQLLWHTSGLPGMFPHDNFKQNSFTGYSKMTSAELDLMMQTNRVSREAAIKSIITDSLDFKPGSAFNYSDVGYLLLGIVIDSITGDYKHYMSAIFKQFDLQNTYFVDQEKVIKNQASGYSLKNGNWVNIMRTWDHDVPSYYGVFSNVQDLIKWQKVISDTNFLNDSNQKFLFSKGRLDDETEISYGCGWELNDLNGLRFISHTGVTGTIMINIPQKKTTIILLSNLGYNGNDIVNPWNLAYELLNAIGIETQINCSHVTSSGLRQVETNKSSFKQIQGTYSTVDNIQAKIVIEKGKGYFESQNKKNQLSLLENGDWIVLGFDYEYILTFVAEEKTLRSNYGRLFKKD